MSRLEGKVALITGAAVGMGASHARRFVEEGAKVVLADIDESAGSALAAELGPDAAFVRHDVSERASWERAMAEVEQAFGLLTVLINNAGITGPFQRLGELAVDDYLRVVSIDMHGVFFGMQAAIPMMLRAGGGSIVNISSTAGFAHRHGSPNVAYTSAKFAVRGLTRGAAAEYARDNIRVNSVHPGGVMTPMVTTQLTEEQIAHLAATDIPLGRLAGPRELSNLVLFLASDESSYVTGAEYLADGGTLA